MEPEKLQEVREQMEAPWHDVREQRVLRGVVASRAARGRRRVIQRRAALISSLVAVAALMLVVLKLKVYPAQVPLSQSGNESDAGSVLTLSDGTKLKVEPRAEVVLEREAPALVEVAQKAGEVAYDVTPNPARRFVVKAAGVTIRVLGTAFIVHIGEDRAVQVEVTRGRVSVDDGAKLVEIGAGERLLRTAVVSAPSTSASSVEPVMSADKPPASAHVEASGGAQAEPPPSVTELLAKADSARAGGRLGEASAALEQLLALYPRDPRAGSARFTLARVARAQGQHAKAALAFRACESGPLGEDALAEEASSWLAAGRSSDARAAANRYLTRYPNGAYAAKMRSMVE
jgi:tetratricopeptide (TPR) repeat protein